MKWNPQTIQDALKQYSDPVRAIRDKAYHKSKREHWGVAAPESNRIAHVVSKALSQKQVLQIASALWETDRFDPMITAAKMLAKLDASEALWEMIVVFLQKVDGWALEDTLAHAAWKCLLADRSRLDTIEEWTGHPNFWMRRAVLVYTLPWAKPNRDPERSLRWASNYSTDPQWFIQKAIGWWLRVLGEHNPERVVIFLQRHWDKLKYVARHEASRKLNQNWKEQFL